MMNRNLVRQCEALMSQHQGLCIASNIDSNMLQLLGVIEINAEYRGVLLFGDYKIRLEIPEEFPEQLPTLYELSGKIPASFEHKYSNGSCCLGVASELYEKLTRQPTLEYYVNEFIIGYFYSVLWFERFGVYPFGERPHNAAGVLEYYKEFWGTDDELLAAKMLYIALTQNAYRGHLPCPCGSGIIGRRCHGQQFERVFSSAHINLYYQDYLYMYDYLNDKRSKNYARR